MSAELIIAQQQNYTLSPAEYALLEGDLSRLDEKSRLSLYNNVCLSLGLNPMTAPFGYIRLSGKLTLYAKKDCTDQLRKIHGVSITDLVGRDMNGAYVVTAKAQDKTGRIDVGTGAVSLEGLKGEALCNALMKAETKSKRRVTLSICGLGMLDESETGSIPGAEVVHAAHSDAVIQPTEEWLYDRCTAKKKSFTASGAELRTVWQAIAILNNQDVDWCKEEANRRTAFDTALACNDAQWAEAVIIKPEPVTPTAPPTEPTPAESAAIVAAMAR